MPQAIVAREVLQVALGPEGRWSIPAPHELQVLLFGGDPSATKAAPVWREIRTPV